jgi:hypothetical protein
MTAWLAEPDPTMDLRTTLNSMIQPKDPYDSHDRINILKVDKANCLLSKIALIDDCALSHYT